IDSFDGLLRQCYQDFGALYEKLAAQGDIEAGALVAGDEVLNRGTLEHFGRAPAAGH
ncbi:MAG: phenylalanine 4-monooxygenase, partial [Proteobacteria bacterium]|nr:phenylalanine 4-monooxygenase [Pseudomonadota bacterium]